MYTIITENDESAWNDETGILYHFPKKYLKYLESGTKVIYYKGTLKNKKFSSKRLSDAPHYFAFAEIGKITYDEESTKGDFFAEITKYIAFEKAVLAKNNLGYLESFPKEQKNYWRNGVRVIDQSTYNLILSYANKNKVSEKKSTYIVNDNLNDISNDLESSSEGKSSKRYVTTYERNPENRKRAIAVHGVTCKACEFNFEQFYGAYAKDYIQIHHITPLSELEGPKNINPETELIPLCANCHAIIHRRKNKTLSIDELIELINENRNKPLI